MKIKAGIVGLVKLIGRSDFIKGKFKLVVVALDVSAYILP